MTPTERAYAAGLAAVAGMARAAAIAIEARPEGHGTRHLAAAEALRTLSEEIEALGEPCAGERRLAGETPDDLTWARPMAVNEMYDPFAGLSGPRRLAWEEFLRSRAPQSGPSASPVRQALALIADQPGASGEIECPRCAGRVRWVRSSVNGHVSGGCQTEGCLSWMM